MTSTTRPIPEGYHSVTPALAFRDAVSAIEFYKKAFGATEGMRLTDPDGKIAHAELVIGDSHIMISEENPEFNHSPQSLGGATVVLHLYVEDVDAVVGQAVDAGAQLVLPVKDQFYGDRAGRVADPYGHVWAIATHTEDVSQEEIEKRFAAFFSGNAAEAATTSGA
jgi:PhnB protein